MGQWTIDDDYDIHTCDDENRCNVVTVVTLQIGESVWVCLFGTKNYKL